MSFSDPLFFPVLFGASALGIAIAFLVAFCLNRFPAVYAKILGSVVLIIAGGVITTLLRVGKEPAWMGYCLGIGLTMFFLVSEGVLGLGKDERLTMLDALHKRQKDGIIESKEFEDLKKSIFEDIKKNPGLAKSYRRDAG